MTTQAVCVYRVARGGLSDSALRAAVAAVPVPPDPLGALGVSVASDGTITSGAFAVRTINFSWVPAVAATVNPPTLNADDELNPLTLSAAGSGYILPPIVVITGGKPHVNASARAWLKVTGASIGAAGSGYSASTFATVVGQLASSKPNARQAQVALTIVAGAIAAVFVTDAGSGYVGVPQVVITDPSVSPGSGAAVSLVMGVGEVEVVHPGQGFESAPTVTLVPAFEIMFPFGRDRPFFNYMTSAIADAVMTPVTAIAPVVS
jgi:hypothetical protein